SVLYSDDMEALRNLTKWLSSQVVDFAEHGGRAVIDCGIPLCAFANDDYGRMAKLGIPVGSCQPRPGILPNMRLYHCDRMTAFPAANASMFKRFQNVREYFYKRYNGLQWDFRFFEECPECPALRLNTCQGHCLAEKGRRLLKEAERLRDIVAEEANQEALVDMGTILYELSQFAQAVECMTEARRVDPADPHVHMILARCLWELGKLADAEEEFRKAARLLPDGREVLAELGSRFEESGKLFKARRLVEEIKRMPPPESDQTGETPQ
ncbi:MAG: tetratricopeptide repeat protein, partial [Lentisphaeria bacterium]|nr:tetratricopeptide repeat protein [Lentisphaeria bacterium]